MKLVSLVYTTFIGVVGIITSLARFCLIRVGQFPQDYPHRTLLSISTQLSSMSSILDVRTYILPICESNTEDYSWAENVPSGVIRTGKASYLKCIDINMLRMRRRYAENAAALCCH